MNCANHRERTATAFCQNCGKPLCPECTRTADGLVLCEPCMLSRGGAAYAGSSPSSYPGQSAAAAPGVPPAASASGAGWQPVPPGASGFGPAAAAPRAAYQSHASPVAAALLGTIPGVGAMYNGQFIKALLHVIIFIVLIGVTEHLPLVGILIGAWYFYQIFDAAQTAAARRDGRPLPDPFGILDLSQRLGPNPGSAAPAYGPAYVPPYAPPPQPSPGAPSSSQAATPGTSAYSPVPPAPLLPPARRSEPIGAIVLIVVGLLFLLSTLGVLDVDWLGRGWPLLLVVLGVWLLIRRVRAPEPMMPAAAPIPSEPGSPVPTAEPPRSTTLSIAPQYRQPARDKEEQ